VDPRVEDVALAGSVGGEHLQTARPEVCHDLGDVAVDDDREVKQAPGTGPDRLGVERVDAVAGQDHGIGTGGGGAPHDRAGVAGVANVGADNHEGRVGRQLGQREHQAAATSDEALRRDGVGDLGHHVVGDDVPL